MRSPNEKRAAILNGQHPETVEDEQQVVSLVVRLRRLEDEVLHIGHVQARDAHLVGQVPDLGHGGLGQQTVLVDDILS